MAAEKEKIKETESISGRYADDLYNMQESCVLNNSENLSIQTSKKQQEHVVRLPQWKCSTYEAKENWDDEIIRDVRIPDDAFKIIDRLIEPLDCSDYVNEDENIPGKAQMMAVAVLEFCTAANVRTVSGGGGGGSSNDLRWDGMTKSDFEKMAELAAKKAIDKCTGHLRRKVSWKRGR
ncbi:MAG: hypothetical protein ACLRYB_17190 [Segatella copri]